MRPISLRVAAAVAAAALLGAVGLLATTENRTLPAVLVLVGLVAAVTAALVVNRALVRPLTQLADQLDVLRTADADRRMVTDGVASLADRPDAIGRIASGVLRESQAVEELTAGQTAMTGTLATTITDVARRGLALVTRLLDRLDVMQREESDAGRLEQLYGLDHLAVRLRGHSENLLVIADAPMTGAPDEEPMQLVDVVRHAASQTEDYRRVTAPADDGTSVLGWASRPLSQLLAALLDNGLRYSPPDRQVVVTAERAAAGVQVLVRDQGIGMDDEALQSALATIAQPPLLQVAQTRQLGLYVVGVLAGRLGVTVHLERPADPIGGLLARVHIPDALLLTTPELVTSPAGAQPAPATPSTPAPTTAPSPASEPSRAVEARRLAAAAVLLPGTEGPPEPIGTPEATPTPEPSPQPAAGSPSRRRRKYQQQISWSITMETPSGDEEPPSPGTPGIAFVNDPHRPGPPVTPTASPEVAASVIPPPRALVVRQSWTGAPASSEPADYIPPVVDNPLLDVLPSHPTAHRAPVLPQHPRTPERALIEAPTVAVLDGIRMLGAAPDTDGGDAAGLPTRRVGTDAEPVPMARLFADMQGMTETEDHDALAGLVAGESGERR